MFKIIMKRHLYLQILLSLFFLTDLYPRPVQTEIKTLEAGAIAPDFSLRGIDDKIYSLKDFSKSPVLVVIKNNSSNKLRLLNIWATWCGPCKTEFPELVVIDRMYRGRDFEFITISADKQERRNDALKFLQSQQASNRNYIFSEDDVYRLIDAVGNGWRGALPFTLLAEPGGKIVYARQDMIDPREMKKLIVENKYIGRYY